MKTNEYEIMNENYLTQELEKNKWKIIAIAIIGFLFGLGVSNLTTNNVTLPPKEFSYDTNLNELDDKSCCPDYSKTIGENNK